VFLGSANGTTAAWGTSTRGLNWEAVVHFRDPKALARFEREFLFQSPSGQVPNPWVTRFEPLTDAGPAEQKPVLDQARRQLGALELRAVYSARHKRLTVVLRLTRREAERLSRLPLNGRVYPRGLPELGVPLERLLRERSATFAEVPLPKLSTLLEFQIAHAEHPGETVTLCLVATMPRGDRCFAERDAAFLAALPKRDQETWLLALLGLSKSSVRPVRPTIGKPERTKRTTRRALGPTVLEALLRCWLEAPEQFEMVKAWLRRQEKAGADGGGVFDVARRVLDGVERCDGRWRKR
jgi:hypothetical protein